MRPRILSIALVLAVLVALISPTRAQASTIDQQRWDALASNNAERTARGVPALTLSSSLNAVAQACAVEVAK